MARAAVVKFNNYLVNEHLVLPTVNRIHYPLNQVGIDFLSFQSIASSATIASVTVDMPAIVLGSTFIVGKNTFTTALPVLYTSIPYLSED